MQAAAGPPRCDSLKLSRRAPANADCLFFCLPSSMMATSRPCQSSSSYSLQHSSPLEALCRRQSTQPVRHRQSSHPSPCSNQQLLKTRPPYPLRKSLHLGWKIENEGFSNGTDGAIIHRLLQAIDVLRLHLHRHHLGTSVSYLYLQSARCSSHLAAFRYCGRVSLKWACIATSRVSVDGYCYKAPDLSSTSLLV